MGSKKSPDRFDQESIPSELSDDIWGELPRFRDYQHQQQMKKEKEDQQRKREAVRKTLDDQLKRQQQEKLERQRQIKQMDQ